MQMLVMIGSDVHSRALREAGSLGKANNPLPVGVLNGPLDDEMAEWLRKIWDKVDGALRRAYREGMEAAKPLIEEAKITMAEIAASFTNRAEEVRAIVSERLNTYLQHVIDGALGRVKSSINIGGKDLPITSVTVQQQIRFSGSLKASLEQVCEFVAEGELALSAEYNAG